MDNIRDILINKRKELGLSLRDAGKLIGISHSYLSTLEKGKDPRTDSPISPTPETLKLISNAYGISYNYLMRISGYLDDMDEPLSINEPMKLTKRDKRDIAKDLEKMMAEIENEDSDTDSESGITFYGEPLDDLDKQLLKNALKHALENVKIKNKEKYTPKKYK
ncbi:hypothetical protein SH2C18_04180 [Clostridium sediminicola]|uniref:helix-turn-helix domain-containing protein n=1 Tax=Clostridium sediminicola TaxID=3114879 RepID=UPI0031F27CA8